MNDFAKFEEDRLINVEKMSQDKKLIQDGISFVEKSGNYKYTYNFDWLGVPIIQLPQDIMAIQELIWKIKPTCIVETGVARGGSLILYASLLEMIGGEGKVLGVEIDLREHNKKNILNHPMAKRIGFIEGSSTAKETFEIVKSNISSSDKVLVILDSNHTHEHVLEELNLYSSLVSKDSYLIVMDTSIDLMPEDYFPDRPWGRGDNPRTAVKEFLKSNSSFEIDAKIHNKLLISVAYDGYLKRIK